MYSDKSDMWLVRFLTAAIWALTVVCSCSSSRKALQAIEKEQTRASIALPEYSNAGLSDSVQALMKDTIIVEDSIEGRSVIMNAVKDETTGEMVASDVIQAAVVSAKFRNVAERNGFVDLEFCVTVPNSMINSNWQLRLYPDMYIHSDKSRLEPIVITGEEYRRNQIRGYERYGRFLNTIITDSTLMVNDDQLRFFLARVISEDGEITDQEAVEHYTDKIMRKINGRKIASKQRMFERYVKAPLDSEGIRLDTVMTLSNGNFRYDYVERIKTRPKFRNARIVLAGEIMENGKRAYTIPDSDTLTFYISSLASFANHNTRYLTKVIERRASADAAFHFNFDAGKHELDESREDNAIAMASIRKIMASLLDNREYDLDSVVVTATASPEGNYALNKKLSWLRGRTVVDRVSSFIRSYRDSARREAGFRINMDDSFETLEKGHDITFVTHNLPENWAMLDSLIACDTVLSVVEKDDYRRIAESTGDLDLRSSMLENRPFYKYVKENLYPKLRIVNFDFALHRKGMVKDTVHTTVIDSAYMKGVEAIENRDFETAVSLLGKYGDFNAAVAYAALGYNHSALETLEKCEPDDKVNYMLALIWSRFGDAQKAVSYYLKACSENSAMVHRGNLDPEIGILIKKYSLNKETNDFQ